LIEKMSSEKSWKKLKVLFNKGYKEEIEDYENFLKERIAVSI